VKNKILIVENNEDSLEILGLYITKLGHQAIKAKNSNEAIAFAEAEAPDLILWTWNCRMSTKSRQPHYLERILRPLIPVVALTAWISALWQEKANKSGY
jgi:CheY-like chemotaxis protein